MRWTWEKLGYSVSEQTPIGNAIPEVRDGTAKLMGVAREERLVKIATSGAEIDEEVACQRLAAEFGFRRVHLISWSDKPETLVASALHPAEIDRVLIHVMIGRAIAIVHTDQKSKAIGTRGSNVRLASKLCAWDIEVMTADEYERKKCEAIASFSAIDGVNRDLAALLAHSGFLSYDDLEVIEPDDLIALDSRRLTAADVSAIITRAEQLASESDNSC